MTDVLPGLPNTPIPDRLAAVRLCSVEGCDKPHLAQGYCNAHYKRWQQYRSPTGGKTAFRGAPPAFIEVALRHQTDDCLLWPYGQGHGYGVLKFNGVKRDAYSLVCELAHGPKPGPKYQAAHSCNVRLCVNPRHLRWDTQEGNLQDSSGEIHWNARLTAKQVQMIRDEKHISNVDFARQLGVSYGTIYAIRTRKIWKHVP